MSAKKSLFKSTTIVSSMTLLSRALGFIRDMLMASLFGATAGFDAFLVAFKIPNFMRGLFAEGSFSQAFVPILAEYQHHHSAKDTLQFIARTLGGLAGILFIITFLCEILAPLIVVIFAPGFVHDPLRYQMAIKMLWITFPYLMLISLTAYCASVLHSQGHFGVAAFTPVILNVVLIAAGIYFSPFFLVHEQALAWGVLVAGIIQLAFQVIFLARYKLFVRPRWHLQDPHVKRVMKNMVPALFGVSVMQIGLLINTFFASFLKEGSISWLYYADRLTFFPLGIFGVALVTVLLPYLSNFHAKSANEDFKSALDWGLKMVLLISIPAMLGLIMMSNPIVSTLFHHGKFNAADVVMTEQGVIAFAIGLPSFMATKILASAFYARQEIKQPVRIAAITVGANIVLNCLLILPLRHQGLALGTSLAAIINAALLYQSLYRTGIYQPQRGWGRFFLQLLFANSMMVLLLVWGAPTKEGWANWQWHQQVLTLFIWLTAAVVVYFSSLWLSGLRFKDYLMHGASSFIHKPLIIER
ncbi:MAG: murein biosynthesis integral membrane protein MurJ [Gammaproteobacteria bacterium]|nr:murein biosynthesis integral membrane protein MurJ [Gammaproteobacteria bacterium]